MTGIKKRIERRVRNIQINLSWAEFDNRKNDAEKYGFAIQQLEDVLNGNGKKKIGGGLR